MKQIRQYKDRIYEEAITYYTENAADNIVYLKYEEGSYIRVASADDLKMGGRYGFFGSDTSGNPIKGYSIANDIDFKGISLVSVEEFSGQILGNGYTLKNISLNVKSKKIDNDSSKTIGLFQNLNGAYIEDLTIQDMEIKMNINSGIPVTVGALAAHGNNTELNNVHINNLTIDTGKGDDGAASYKVGDLFATHIGNKLQNVTGSNIAINASDSAQVELLLEQ